MRGSYNMETITNEKGIFENKVKEAHDFLDSIQIKSFNETIKQLIIYSNLTQEDFEIAKEWEV